MSDIDPQGSLFEGESPAGGWDRDVARRTLDELFSLTQQYRASKAYRELLDFVGRFRFYAPFNAMLVHLQMPGSGFVAPPHRWLVDYGRRIKVGASPLVILRPMGPVMFVFDVSDTEAEPDAPPLPREVLEPFEVRGGRIGSELERTMENAKRDGIDVIEQRAGSQSAGLIRVARRGGVLSFLVRERPDRQEIRIPVRYEVLLNGQHS